MASLKQKELTAALNRFYQKPIAMISLELLLSIGLVTFLAIFAIQPTLLTMSDLIKEREEKTKLAEDLSKKAVAMQTVQTVYMQAAPKLPQLEQAIPPQPELIRSIKIIEKLASETNIIIETLSVRDIPDETVETNVKVDPSRVNLPVRLTITGEYLDIRAFVEALKNSRRVFIVDSITFSLEENRGERKLKASLSVSQPYLGVPTL